MGWKLIRPARPWRLRVKKGANENRISCWQKHNRSHIGPPVCLCVRHEFAIELIRQECCSEPCPGKPSHRLDTEATIRSCNLQEEINSQTETCQIWQHWSTSKIRQQDQFQISWRRQPFFENQNQNHCSKPASRGAELRIQKQRSKQRKQNPNHTRSRNSFTHKKGFSIRTLPPTVTSTFGEKRSHSRGARLSKFR